MNAKKHCLPKKRELKPRCSFEEASGDTEYTVVIGGLSSFCINGDSGSGTVVPMPSRRCWP